MSERPTPDLEILETRVYRGANVWSYEKSIHLVVDLGSLEQFPTNTLPGFTDDLVAMLPGLREHSCSRGTPRRLRRAPQRGHLAGPRRRARRARAPAGRRPRHPPRQDPQVKGQPGVYNIIYGYIDEHVGLAAGALAVRLVNHLVEGDPDFDWETERDDFISRAERTAFGPSTQAIVDEAVSRDIPWIRLNQYSLVQLGQGVHAKRIRATMTSETSSIAVDIASDKDLTTKLLGAAGLPVPKQESVRTADRRVAVADRIGYPVVRQAARRQPRPRRLPRPAERGRRPRRRSRSPRSQSRRGVRDRRVVRDRQGLPLPDHRRPDGRHRRARAGLSHRRRHLDRRAARRPDQRRPAPRRRATRRC